MFDRWMNSATRFDLHLIAASLALLSFSLPGRDGPEAAGGVDVIAFAKLGARIIACIYFALLFFWMWTRNRTKFSRPNVSGMMVPWIFFAGWSLLSVTWSALPVVSIGQWFGLVALLGMSQTIAWRYRESLQLNLDGAPKARRLIASDRFDSIEIFVWIHAITFIYCAAVMMLHFVAPEVSGLSRDLRIGGINGIVHPTAAGATSSLGVLLGVFLVARGLTKHRFFLIAMVSVELALLYCSTSRAALLMTVICLLVYGLFLTPRRMQGIAIVAIGMGLLTTISVDPGFELIGSGIDSVGAYIRRGQTTDQLKNVSGRSEMWAAIGEQIRLSPIVGHGYFVTSADGKLDVWQGPANQDAHNVLLQVLVTTGLIGMVPFLWALGRMAHGLLTTSGWAGRRHTITRSDVDFSRLAALLCLWFAGWSQGCVTFLGPVRPESVVFFVLLGLLAGRIDFRRNQIMMNLRMAPR